MPAEKSLEQYLEFALGAAKAGAAGVMRYYGKIVGTRNKKDGSPLTLADQESHDLISEILSGSGVPIVSEEGDDLLLEETRYWLVDPLDGTKDFLAANGEFTINIALIENGRPTVGVVYAPALEEMYAGISGRGAWKEQAGVRIASISAVKSAQLRMAVSRFHDHDDNLIFAKKNNVAECVPVGSALKFGRLAMGEIDVYARLVGTSEWDTAAGQAVLEAAGGSVLDWHTGGPLAYGKELRRNPRFLAFRHPYERSDFICEHYEPKLL